MIWISAATPKHATQQVIDRDDAQTARERDEEQQAGVDPGPHGLNQGLGAKTAAPEQERADGLEERGHDDADPEQEHLRRRQSAQPHGAQTR